MFNILLPLSICFVEPQVGFKIAFNMFDTDGNNRVEKDEFLVVSNQLKHYGSIAPPDGYF